MNIGRPYFLVLAALPLLEIVLLIRLGALFGFLATLLYVLLGAAVGISLIRYQGMTALLRSQQALARGELPAADVIRTGIGVIGGVLLVIPGPLTDLLSLPCLIPAVRNRLADRLMASRFFTAGLAGEPASAPDSIIEGEYRRED